MVKLILDFSVDSGFAALSNRSLEIQLQATKLQVSEKDFFGALLKDFEKRSDQLQQQVDATEQLLNDSIVPAQVM